MSRTRRAMIATTALLAVFGVAPALGQDDDLPPLPPLPKPSDKAVFKLIVEGRGGASQSVNGSGNNGVCDISTSTDSRQTYEYGRGKGLRVAFSKYKVPGGKPIVLLTRVGQSGGALFTVVGSYEAEANGSATRSGNPACGPPANETVGDEDDCGPSGPKRTNLSFTSTFEGELVLAVSEASPGIPGIGCGSNGVESVSGTPLYGWPNLPPLDPESIPVSKVFGKKRAFKIEFDANPNPAEGDHVVSSIVIRSINTGGQHATARFVREKKG